MKNKKKKDNTLKKINLRKAEAKKKKKKLLKVFF